MWLRFRKQQEENVYKCSRKSQGDLQMQAEKLITKQQPAPRLKLTSRGVDSPCQGTQDPRDSNFP